MEPLRDVPSGNSITGVLGSFYDCQSLKASWTDKGGKLSEDNAWHYHTGCKPAAARSRFFHLP
jgi:hypothetical protein